MTYWANIATRYLWMVILYCIWHEDMRYINQCGETFGFISPFCTCGGTLFVSVQRRFLFPVRVTVPFVVHVTDSPAFVSQPHFYNADPVLLDYVLGLGPSEEKHETFIEIHPVSAHTHKHTLSHVTFLWGISEWNRIFDRERDGMTCNKGLQPELT